MIDPYKTLGVGKNSSQDEIKKAHRKLAKKYHPDANGGNKEMEEKFKEISEAYEILSDPNKKMQFDTFGSVGNSRGNEEDIFGRFRNHSAQKAAYEFAQSAFGQRSRNIMVNPDIRVVLRINLSDSIFGCTKECRINRLEACSECESTGGKGKGETCKTCKGRGQIISRPNNFTQVVSTCHSCDGFGEIFEKCDKCDGIGYTNITETVKIKVPPNINQGATIRLPEKGNTILHNNGKHTGHYYLVVDFPMSESGITRRSGDLCTSINVPIDKILSEEEVQVRCFNRENVKLKLDCSKKDDLYKLSPSFLNGNNLFVKVIPEIPSKYIAEDKRKELVKAIRNIYGESESVISPTGNQSGANW